MCSYPNCGSDVPLWLRSSVEWTWKHRDSVGLYAPLGSSIAMVIALLFYMFSPTEFKRAEADIKTARMVIASLEDEAQKQLDEADGHRKREAEIRALLEKWKDTTDKAWVEWKEAQASAHAQMDKAKRSRRDHLLRMTAQHLHLLADAECEIVRAKNAHDHQTPYPVAARVQEILAPVVAHR